MANGGSASSLGISRPRAWLVPQLNSNAPNTTNGNVHLELARLPDKTGATAETTNGSLVLAVPSDLQADVEARCLNGNFFSELPITMASSQRPREMHGKLGHGGAPIHLRTVNGGIRVVILRSTV